MENAGTGTTTNSTLTFSDSAAGTLPQTGALPSGTYKPTAYTPATTYPAPAPAGPYGTTLAVFNGTAANGIWSLYVFDDGAGDSGSFAGGWELSVLTTNCVAPTPSPTPTCMPRTFIFEGNSAQSGTAGNIRPFTVDGVTVNVSGFSRRDSNGAWTTSFLGLYNEGVGVTGPSEGTGSNNQHAVDNIGGYRDYVLFEFSAPITAKQAFLNYIYAGHSDMSAWIGTTTNPIANHNTLSDAFLASLGTREDNNTTSTASSRWAVINAAQNTGNVLVIAASVSDPARNDGFKIHKLLFCPGGAPNPNPTATPASPANPGNLANVSTRLFVQTGDNVMIGGFIIAGDAPKDIILRALGPSLTTSGISGAIPDPALRLYDSTGAIVASNDNWRSDQSQIIEDTGLASGDDREAALVTTLSPGAYTVVVNDENNNAGVGLFDLYDLDPTSSQLVNLSTRGKIETEDRVMIGGFIIGGDQPTQVILRAIGPSLTQLGIQAALVDPTLELHNGDGSLVVQNDNWRSDQEQEILNSTLAPSDERESAIIATLIPGPYTAIVRGAGNSTGIAVFEIYRLTP
jgi:hypothetical protein